MTKVGKLYEQEKIEYANKQRENTIIDIGREDGKSDEEIIRQPKKRLGYDDKKAAEAINLVEETQAREQVQYEQMDLFTDYDALEKERKDEKEKLSKERKLQEAVLSVKKKFGKNAVLKSMNLQEGTTTIERNRQIGGHKA